MDRSGIKGGGSLSRTDGHVRDSAHAACRSSRPRTALLQRILASPDTRRCSGSQSAALAAGHSSQRYSVGDAGRTGWVGRAHFLASISEGDRHDDYPVRSTPTGRQSTRDAAIRKRDYRAYRLRSEEHTSELQSLMRISYAVFCLKKKTQKS